MGGLPRISREIHDFFSECCSRSGKTVPRGLVGAFTHADMHADTTVSGLALGLFFLNVPETGGTTVGFSRVIRAVDCDAGVGWAGAHVFLQKYAISSQNVLMFCVVTMTLKH